MFIKNNQIINSIASFVPLFTKFILKNFRGNITLEITMKIRSKRLSINEITNIYAKIPIIWLISAYKIKAGNSWRNTMIAQKWMGKTQAERRSRISRLDGTRSVKWCIILNASSH
jgi:hypothetical protein